MTTSRPSRELIFRRFVDSVAERSTCDRLQVGAAVVTSDGRRILGFGYNGNAAGLPNQCDELRAGHCGCVHAEANALISAGDCRGSTLYTTDTPCTTCAKLIINAGIVRVVSNRRYRDSSGMELLRTVGIEVSVGLS